jgi:hypothetical protein
VENKPTIRPLFEEVAMRQRAFVLLALAALVLNASRTRLAADPKPPEVPTAAGVIFQLVPGDTRCPAATHLIKYCNFQTGTFLAFDNPNRRHNNLPTGYVTVRGAEDFEACPPYRLVHVKLIGKFPHDVFPPPCEPPTYP